ncbi:MAG: methyltransferase domain-containing protein [Flavobacteriales bacterium]|nr:methyltransferase domain-containing protein [Flavobacteriales bacterium]MBK9539477.1 methyltransferase domain-containing protein [Flavobacteriales bacterium]
MAALLPNGLKRRLRDLALRGDAVHCPLCHRGAIAFLPSGTPPRPHALCPFCGSLERTRMMGLALKERGLPKPGHRVLHVAPDRSLREMLRKAPGVTYIAGDKQAPGYSYPQDTIDLDITALDFPDDHFDLIICSHVLEHVPEDRTAMRELCRVLRPGGTAILLVPMSDRPTTDEDPSVTDPQERFRRFGQTDHVRLYGRDYMDRLREAGFIVTVDDMAAQLPPADVFRYGLLRRDLLVIGSK